MACVVYVVRLTGCEMASRLVACVCGQLVFGGRTRVSGAILIQSIGNYYTTFNLSE